jgi:hypothetical protein
MEQAGVYRITLYENKDLTLLFTGDDVTNIISSGAVIPIENDNCETQEISLVQQPQRSANNKLKYRSRIDWLLFDYSIERLQLINQIKQSIYGWIAKIDFYNSSSKVIPSPLRFIEALNDNNSSSFGISIENVVLGDKLLNFIEGLELEWILEQGVWNDSGIWIDSELWKDS